MAKAEQPGDPNMALARHFATSLGPAPPLPQSLQPVERRAELVHRIDAPLVAHLELFAVVERIATRVRDIIRITPEFMPDVEDPIDRLNIALRLWSGCLSAAKTIAYETRSGPNDAALRARIMPEVDAIAEEDPIYVAGVESAPAFKRLRGQGYSFEASLRDRRYGAIPSNSRGASLRGLRLPCPACEPATLACLEVFHVPARATLFRSDD